MYNKYFIKFEVRQNFLIAHLPHSPLANDYPILMRKIGNRYLYLSNRCIYDWGFTFANICDTLIKHTLYISDSDSDSGTSNKQSTMLAQLSLHHIFDSWRSWKFNSRHFAWADRDRKRVSIWKWEVEIWKHALACGLITTWKSKSIPIVWNEQNTNTHLLVGRQWEKDKCYEDKMHSICCCIKWRFVC